MLTSDIDKFFSLQQACTHFRIWKSCTCNLYFQRMLSQWMQFGSRKSNFENLSFKMGNGDVIKKFNIYTEFWPSLLIQ